MVFWAYMLHCRGGALYTGHTENLEQRIAEHQSGLMPGFTQDKHPLKLVWSQEFATRYEALSAERQIKGWSKRKKLALIRGDRKTISGLAKSKNGPSTSSGRTGLGITVSAFSTITEEAARTVPEEACGLLFGTPDRIVEATVTPNVHPSPRTHFEIDPAALIAAHKAERAGGPAIVGYWHSHPAGPALPSATDTASASGDGKVWAIAAGEKITFWRDTPAGFEALPYRCVAG